MSNVDSSRVGYINLKLDDVNIKLSLLKVDSLRIHEKVIPQMLNTLIKKIKRDNVIFDPIVADGKLNFVIDGAHRVLALKELGIELIPAIDVDYFDDSIIVKRWFRVVKNVSLSYISRRIKQKARPMSYEDFLDALDSGYVGVGFYYHDSAILYEDDLDLATISNILERFSANAQFITEEKGRNAQGIVIGYRKLEKKEIIDYIHSGQKFTYKFTRHVIPVRILSVNIPISLLRINKVEKALRYLNRLTFKKLGKGITIDDRIYEEEVFIGTIS